MSACVCHDDRRPGSRRDDGRRTTPHDSPLDPGGAPSPPGRRSRESSPSAGASNVPPENENGSPRDDRRSPRSESSQLEDGEILESAGRSSRPTNPKKRKRSRPVANSGKGTAMASQMQMWQRRREELHDGPSKEDSGRCSSAPGSPQAPKEDDDDGFIGRRQGRHCCFLCATAFRDAAHVDDHLRSSKKHAANLRDEALKKKVRAKVAASEAAGAKATAAGKPQLQPRKKQSAAASPPAEPTTPRDAESDGGASAGKYEGMGRGMAMLARMGWKEGAGLGAEGSGMATAIETRMFARG
ncbi:hypothetical protein BDY21DRAFT_375078, partial [Lineolata rhizophorae]